MHKVARFRNALVHLLIEREGGEVIVRMAIAKDAGTEPLHSDTVALALEDAEGELLAATRRPRFGFLPETGSAGAAAHASFGFADPHRRPLKRAIAVLRGEVAEALLEE